ncbi:MAG: IseA DL-endopeptidase inhibitor family protein [Defluviitaleaceae bacterium]|nr:IseA DL-endopeptidase inhibitor family protein [Defluviitaleaceae bacterium]
MKKLLYTALFTVILLVALVACNGNSEDYISEPNQIHALEEMGNIIITVGNLWEDWWSLTGNFAYVEYLPWQSLDDVRNFLLQYYTENFVDAYLLGENSIFAEYDGTLFVNGNRMGSGRHRWDNATHVLVEQEGNRAIVETTFHHGFWHRDDVEWEPTELRFRFHFVDGKIDMGLDPWGRHQNIIWPDTFQSPGTWLPSLEQLGEMIVTAGGLWEDWWFGSGHFASLEYDDIPTHLSQNAAFGRFPIDHQWQSLEDVRNYLSQFYTESYIYTHIHSAFEEYDGRLFANVTRIGTMRPMWDDAIHFFYYTGDNKVIVVTEFQMGYPRGGDWWTDMTEARFYTHFVNGRIDIGTSPWTWGDDIVWMDRIWTFDEVKQTIQRAGYLWENWWNFEHAFAPLYLGWLDAPMQPVPPHLNALGYFRMYPSPWFVDMHTLRQFLSHFYTDSWIDNMLAEEIPIFMEYNGELFVMTARNNHPRPDWETATFQLVEQDGNRFVIDVVVNLRDAEGVLQHRFTIIDGVIDEGLSPWVTWEDVW